MSICQREERAAGRPYPRTCPTCKLGPCSRSTMTTDPKDAEIARLRDAIEKAEQQADYGQIDACRRILSDALQRKAEE